jgi:hypothetical protein
MIIVRFYPFFIILVIAILQGCTSFGLVNDSLVGEKGITPDIIRKDIFYLASDSLRGRNTPSPELDIAANYIASEFISFGLQPVNGSYFQNINLAIVNLGEDNHLIISKDGKETSFKIKNEFTPFEITANKEVNAPIIFAGYGITAPEYNYDDYANIDVKGKIVFVLRHEPGEEDSSSVFMGKKMTDFAQLSTKAKIAIKHGAVGMLLATDPLNHNSLTPRGFPWPSLPMSLRMEEEKKIPVVQVGEEVINLLFGSVDSLKNIQSEIDNHLTPRSFNFTGITASLKTTTKVKYLLAKNVVGFLEGGDSTLRNEVVIIGAHYDHVGYKKIHDDTTDYIYNGADDNASGTTGVLAIAAGFAAMNQKPRRSVLFITFAGEEKGLLGSQAYVEQPLFPLNNTVAMLNLDMIGRNSEDTVYIIGAPRSPDLAKITEEENRSVGFNLSLAQEKYFGGSDHVSFYKKKIPVLFYHSGEHADYHKVTDHAEFINTNKIAKVARLAFRTAWRIANEEKHYRIISK